MKLGLVAQLAPVSLRLCWLDVIGTRAFLTHAIGIGHLLACTQLIELYTLDGRRVEEQVLAIHGRDESESFVQYLLDKAFGHFCISRNVWLEFWSANDAASIPSIDGTNHTMSS